MLFVAHDTLNIALERMEHMLPTSTAWRVCVIRCVNHAHHPTLLLAHALSLCLFTRVNAPLCGCFKTHTTTGKLSLAAIVPLLNASVGEGAFDEVSLSLSARLEYEYYPVVRTSLVYK